MSSDEAGMGLAPGMATLKISVETRSHPRSLCLHRGGCRAKAAASDREPDEGLVGHRRRQADYIRVRVLGRRTGIRQGAVVHRSALSLRRFRPQDRTQRTPPSFATSCDATNATTTNTSRADSFLEQDVVVA